MFWLHPIALQIWSVVSPKLNDRAIIAVDFEWNGPYVISTHDECINNACI